MSKILVVASAEGFIIKGLVTKLEGISMTPIYTSPKMADLQANIEGSELIIIYTDDKSGMMADSLVFLKDYCFEKDAQIIVIGTKEEYGEVMHYISDSLILKFYERPLDMQVLLTEVEQYMEAKAKYLRKKNILIVDDDVSYMTMITDWLKDVYRVSMANSGVEAITWLAKNRPDLILLDYEMPVTPGPVVFEMIKSNAATSDIPVMFLTGKGDKESVMKVLSLKPVGYVLKNVKRDELRENIAKYFASQMKI